MTKVVSNWVVFVGIAAIASGMILLIFFPMFANDADSLNLDKESCLVASGTKVNLKCRGWFSWFHSALSLQHPSYPLYAISFVSCYSQIMAAGVIYGLGWLAVGVIAVVLTQKQPRALVLVYQFLSWVLYFTFAIVFAVLIYKIEFYKMDSFDRLESDSERDKFSESSDGIYASAILVVLLTLLPLAATGKVAGYEKGEAQMEEVRKEDVKKEEEKKELEQVVIRPDEEEKEKEEMLRQPLMEEEKKEEPAPPINDSVVEQHSHRPHSLEEEEKEIAQPAGDSLPVGETSPKKAPRFVVGDVAEMNEAIARGEQLVICEDRVLDLQDFIREHPEDRETLGLHVGCEVSELVYRKMVGDILEEPVCGTIKDTIFEDYLVETKAGKDLSKYSWTIEGQEGWADKYFKLTLSNPDISTRLPLTHFQHFGKYFTIERDYDRKRRNFALIFNLQGSTDAYLTRVANAITKDEEVVPEKQVFPKKIDSTISFLLCSSVEFSDWLGSSSSPESVRLGLRGPYGLGLDVDPHEKTTVVAIVHDYGILLYLDLIVLLFRACTAKLGEETGKDYSLFEGEDTAMLRATQMRLVLMLTCSTNQQSLPYRAIMDATAKLSKEKGYGHFELRVKAKGKRKGKGKGKAKGNGKPEWDEEELKSVAGAGASRVLLSVPEACIAPTKDRLIKAGVAEHSIRLVCTQS